MIHFFDDFGDPDPDPGPERDLEPDLDEEFPLGDGTADTAGTVVCPYCGSPIEIALDPGSGASQDYVEDCEVCCRPWSVRVRYARDGSAHVEVEAADSPD